jgi:hypothetical protein
LVVGSIPTRGANENNNLPVMELKTIERNQHLNLWLIAAKSAAPTGLAISYPSIIAAASEQEFIAGDRVAARPLALFQFR